MARPCPKDKFSGGPMKLSTRILIAFLIIILVPVALTFFLMFGVAMFQGERLLSVYGIDVMNLTNEIKILLIDALFCMICILVITGIILGFWLISGISSPIENLTKATKNIRDGNLDFEVKVEGVQEIQELCKDFEEMRVKLKLANEEKLEADRQNRELISNISHDLKTPITAVKGYVEGIMDGVADTPEKMDRYIRTIYNKANEMDRLINELTFYSKINTNRIPYNFNKVNVREYFDDAAEELEYDLTAKNVEFEYQNAVAPEVMVIADVEQMRRVINNIVGNSVKYMDKEEKKINNIVGNSVKYMDKEEKKISLHIRDAGDEIEVSITDNGKGIPSKDIGNIFNRFYRADTSRNSGQGGSGIGLSIVKKIMEDHGGRVWAESKEGEGTTMTFSLRKYVEG